MIGHSLRKTPGIRPKMTWTFVQAPLGLLGEVVFSWRGERGVIYMSRKQFQVVQTLATARAYICGVAERIEVNFDGPHVEVVPFPLTGESIEAEAVTRFLKQAAGHPIMQKDAFIIISLIAQRDPDVEVPFVEWAEQLPVAI